MDSLWRYYAEPPAQTLKMNILFMCNLFVYISWVCFLILQLIVQQSKALLLRNVFLMKCFFFVELSKGISIMVYIFLIFCYLHTVTCLDVHIFLTWMKLKKHENKGRQPYVSVSRSLALCHWRQICWLLFEKLQYQTEVVNTRNKQLILCKSSK